MVGGFATYLHGHYRYTQDVDLYIDDTLDNRKNLRKALPFLHINQLIDNKKAVNRPKDQADVVELERIRSLTERK